jgi:hypothetical protein
VIILAYDLSPLETVLSLPLHQAIAFFGVISFQHFKASSVFRSFFAFLLFFLLISHIVLFTSLRSRALRHRYDTHCLSMRHGPKKSFQVLMIVVMKVTSALISLKPAIFAFKKDNYA